MCPSCDRLRAELREVKEELAEWKMGSPSVDGDKWAFLASTIGLAPQPAKIVSALMESPSQPVMKDTMFELMEYGGMGRDFIHSGHTDEGRALSVIVTHARRRLESFGIHDAIKNVRGVGYIMPRSKAVELRAILEAA